MRTEEADSEAPEAEEDSEAVADGGVRTLKLAKNQNGLLTGRHFIEEGLDDVSYIQGLV